MLSTLIILGLIGVGSYDLYLMYKGEKSITERWRALFDNATDTAITFGVIAAAFALFPWTVALAFTLGTIHGHLNWTSNK